MKEVFFLAITMILPALGEYEITCEHDIHISVTEMNIQDQDVEIAVKIFKDDLFVALLGHFDQKEIPEDVEHISLLVNQYVNDKLKISAQNRSIPISFVRIEPGFDAIWSYFTVPSRELLSNSLTIENKLLFEIFDDQTNILNVQLEDVKKVITFGHQTPSRELEF